jgi:putative endonuclease
VTRVGQHRRGIFEGFTERYDCKTLVWYETFETVPAAIRREKQIKRWRRKWKLELIEAKNPQWLDLAEPWFTPMIPVVREME